MTPEQIADAQRRLGLPVTGCRNDALTAAVRRFQMEAGLLVTGDLDQGTYRRLWEERLLGARTERTGGSSAARADGDVTNPPD